MPGTKPSVFLISLGCAKNLVDSEHMLGLLDAQGYPLVSGPEAAEVLVINTCGFIQPAVEEAIDTILEAVRLTGAGAARRVVVTGCLVQRYGYKLAREIPEVSAWLGTGAYDRIVEAVEAQGTVAPVYINRPAGDWPAAGPRLQSTPFYSAYLRVAEGCSHRCAFCMIPRLRGPFRSRPPEDIVREARAMVARGVKEINLVAQDTGYYGRDLGSGEGLEDLIVRLVAIRGLAWLRILYLHPEGVSDRLLDLMDNEAVLCPYLDVPLQHVHPGLLERMRQRPPAEPPAHLVARIRGRRRRIAIRTTLMVGFPGETEAMFTELLEFVRQAGFDHLGGFAYSPEAGTRAARFRRVPGPGVARRRLDRLMALQAEVALATQQALVGRIVPVLVEGFSPETDLLLSGRTPGMAPEVDGQVLINDGRADVGAILPVRITEAFAHDLVGAVVGS